MLVVVIERFKSGQAGQIYLRLRKHGRMLPEGVRYIDSWVDHGFTRCFQLMEAEDYAALQQWAANWSDLVDFEFWPVRTGSEAFAIAADWESVKHLPRTQVFRPRRWSREHGGVAAEYIIQSDEKWYEAAIRLPGEPARLLGGAPSREAAEDLASRQLASLEHRTCTDSCQREWTQTPDD
jgi:hypothetical protein